MFGLNRNAIIGKSTLFCIRFALIGGWIACALLASSAPVFALPAVTVTQPSGTMNFGEDPDYMTRQWRNPWDMNEESDLYFFVSPTCDSTPAKFSSNSFSNGIWTGTYAVTDPNFWLIHPGYPGALHIGKDGGVYPIDANTYTQLTFRMYLDSSFDPQSTPGGMLTWTRTDVSSIPNVPNDYGQTNFFRVYPGWNVYTIDLTQIGLQQGNLAWGGQITGLMLWPGFLTTGTTVKIDWVRLTPKQSRTVAWSGSWQSSASAELQFSSDGSTYETLRVFSNNKLSCCAIVEPDVIPAGSNGTSGSYNVPASFAPGSYPLKVKVTDGTGAYTSNAAGPWQFNTRLRLTVTAPSYTSGEDFSTSIVGNTWDMNDAADISSWENLSVAPSYSNGIMTATSISAQRSCGLPWGEPKLMLNMNGKSINTQYYRYLTIKVKVNATFDFGDGWVSRLHWVKDTYATYGTTNDMPLYLGWNTFQVDLHGNIQDDEMPGTASWLSTSPNIMRFDPFEIPPATQFQIDEIKLTARDAADASYTIRWDTYNPGSLPTNITLYYDTDRNPSNGRTLIGAVSGNPGSYVWNTSALSNGLVLYVSGDVNDGYGTTTWYSETPVTINRAPTIIVNKPNGLNDTIAQGNEYATRVRGDPWDMSQSTDVAAYAGITSPVFGNGIFSGTTSVTGGSYLDLKAPSTGLINPAIYQNLVFRMYSGNQVPSGYSVWWRDLGGSWRSWNAGNVVAGWNIYSLNLASQSGWNNGVLKDQLRIYPAVLAGNSFQLDWVKLTQPNSAVYTLQWTTTNASNATISLYYDTTGSGFNGNPIVLGLSGTTTSYPWDVSALDTGNYYIYAIVDNSINPRVMQYAGGPLTVLHTAGTNYSLFLPLIVR